MSSMEDPKLLDWPNKRRRHKLDQLCKKKITELCWLATSSVARQPGGLIDFQLNEQLTSSWLLAVGTSSYYLDYIWTPTSFHKAANLLD